MREIKFRAWCKDKMYKVDTLGFDEGGIRDSMSFAHKERNEFIDECVILTNAIFMQYTGLKDKSGVEIYEGDKLKISGYSKRGLNTGHTEYEVVVTFDKMCWSCGSKSLYNYSTIDWANIEVIGNIYEEVK